MQIVYEYDYDDPEQQAVMFAVMDVMRGHAVKYETNRERRAAELAARMIHEIEKDSRRTFLRLVYSVEPSTGEAKADLA